MHVYHQSTCTLLKNNFSSTLAHDRRRSHTVIHGRTSSHTVEHHHTQSDMVKHHRTDILLKNCRKRLYIQPHMVEHGRTNLFLPNTVAQTTAYGCTHDRTRSHMVAQKILSCQNGLPSPLNTSGPVFRQLWTPEVSRVVQTCLECFDTFGYCTSELV